MSASAFPSGSPSRLILGGTLPCWSGKRVGRLMLSPGASNDATVVFERKHKGSLRGNLRFLELYRATGPYQRNGRQWSKRQEMEWYFGHPAGKRSRIGTNPSEENLFATPAE